MAHEKAIQTVESKSEISQNESANPPAFRLSKTHTDYWKSRLRQRTYFAGGVQRMVPEWQVQLGKNGRQRWVNLGTANKDAAAKKARDTWKKLDALGWDAVKPERERIINPSVGEFLAAVRAEADLHPVTFEIYAKKFRRLVAGVFGIRADKQKHDHVHGGHAAWLARIHAVKFSRLTPRAVQRWKTRYIATAGGNPLRERRVRRTLASVLRSSKALFAPSVIAKLQLELPTPLPLSEIEIPRVSIDQYVSHIDPELLFRQAQQELESPSYALLRSAAEAASLRKKSAGPAKRRFSDEATTKRIARTLESERVRRHQMFRAFCLALLAGLRRDEIDTLTWSQIDFSAHSIRIETNEYTRAKSEGSETGVDIDAAFAELLRAWMKAGTSKFVIETDIAPRPEVSTYHHYRCAMVFSKLTSWLKAHGINTRNSLHALRKEFGTQINRAHGLFAASAALRHSSVQLTRSVYVAKKDRAVFVMPGISTKLGADSTEEKMQKCS
jgi:integrase